MSDFYDFELDEIDHDLVIEDGDFKMVTSRVAYVAQEIWIRLSTFEGEWVYDSDLGIPYFQSILGFKYSAPKLTAIFREELLKVEYLDAIISLDTSWDGATRKVTISWEVRVGDDTITDSKAIEV